MAQGHRLVFRLRPLVINRKVGFKLKLGRNPKQLGTRKHFFLPSWFSRSGWPVFLGSQTSFKFPGFRGFGPNFGFPTIPFFQPGWLGFNYSWVPVWSREPVSKARRPPFGVNPFLNLIGLKFFKFGKCCWNFPLGQVTQGCCLGTPISTKFPPNLGNNQTTWNRNSFQFGP